MKNIAILLMLLFLSKPSFPQTKSNLVNRKVLMYTKYNGNNRVVPRDSIKNKTDDKPSGSFTISLNQGGDSYFNGLMPYEQKWPFDIYMEDLHAKQFKYVYNDVFISNDIYGVSNRLLEDMDINPKDLLKLPKLDFNQLKGSNKSYVMLSRIQSVAKFWVLDAEWEVHSIKHKPNYLKGMSAMNLIFDTYNIYILKKIKSIAPLDTIDPRSSSVIVQNGIFN